MFWTEIADRRAAGAVVLEVRGHLTLQDEDRKLMSAVADKLAAGERRFVLNLRHVSFIDSPGIGEIVGAYTRVTRVGGTFRICEASPRVNEVLKATNLDSVLELFEHESDALTHG
jgi:anti-sigma B factor antagonist